MTRILTILVCLIILPISLLAQSDFQITNSTNQEHEPVVAYNSTNDEYLVVWSEMAPLGMGNYLFGGVYGQRYSSEGQKKEAAFTIFDMATKPSVAYCPTKNEYLVAVRDNGIRLQLLNSSGGKIASSAQTYFPIFDYPQVIYNDLGDEYCLALYDLNLKTIILWRMQTNLVSFHQVNFPINNDSTFSITYAPISTKGSYLLSTSSKLHYLINNEMNTSKAISLVTGFPEGGYVDGEGYTSLSNSTDAIVDAAFGYKDGKAVFMVVYADNNNKWMWPEREGVTTELLCGVWGGYIDAENPPDQVTDSYFPIGDWLLERNCLARWKPKVVYNNVANKFIVAWNETPTTASGNNATVPHIRATDKFSNEIGFINTVLSTKNINVNPDYPVIATSTKSNKAFVVWEDHRNSSTNDIDLYGSMYSFTITPPPLTVPIAPDNLVATLSPPNTINLTWRDNSNNEDEFHLEKKDPDSGTWTEIGILGSNTTSYTDPGLELGKTYYYRVRAKNSIGYSTYSNEAHATTSSSLPIPSAPSNLTAALTPPNTIDLLWNDNSNNEEAFHIERKESASGSWSEIGVLGGNTTSFTDPGLGGGITYYYRVRAKNSFGFSAYSNEANATTSTVITIPSAPSNLTAALTPPNTIDILWDDNSDNEEAFHVERKESASGTWAEIGVLGANTTSITDPGLGGGITFYYRVRAKNSAGFSAYSNESNASTQTTSSITVISPNGGEVWNLGTQYEIKWTSTNFTGPVRIDIKPVGTNPMSFTNLVLNTPNDGSFLYRPQNSHFTETPPFQGSIRVADATKNDPDQSEDGKVYDWSDNYFTVNLANNTGVGTNVVVNVSDSIDSVTLTFDNVTDAGTTTMTKKPSGITPPTGFQICPGSGLYYDINTTAIFTGNIKICINYNEDYLIANFPEFLLQLWVYEVPPGKWKNITTSVDVNANIICGEIDHLTEFAIMIPTGGGMIVSNTDDSGAGSLREAINSANAHIGMDTILFNIPKDVPGHDANLGAWTIEPQTPLPTITDEGLLIDGFSQSAFIGEDTNPAGPEIQLLGSNAGEYSNGLDIKAPYIDVLGLAINDFSGTGIFVQSSEGGRISGCYVGCGVRGDIDVGNGYGIILSRTRNYLVAPIDTFYNVISGNTNVGVLVADTSIHNEVAGNIIGLDKNRGESIPNENYGGINISFESDSNYVVDNLISGNSSGVRINNSDNNHILNNLIGTNYEWIAVRNEDNGIYISEGAQGNLIKENVIGFNGGSGVFIRGSEAKFNIITRNSITLNESWGIRLDHGANESIAPPEITSASQNDISGTAIPNSIVEIFTDPNLQGMFFHDSTIADASGNFSWSGTIESEFTNVTTTATDENGNTSMFSDPVIISSVDSKNQDLKPDTYELSQNHPNPFNPTTRITYSIPSESYVSLKVFDVIGREVVELVNEEKSIGNYAVEFNASDLTSGIYFYRIQAGNFVKTKKMVLMK